jgi:phosphoglycolate phosphatase
MIGDREFDVLAAKCNRIPTVGVTWGYGSREELTHAGAAVLCEAPVDLASTVLGLLRGAGDRRAQ